MGDEREHATYISPSEVNEATELSSKGYQRLRSIKDEGETFCFDVSSSCPGHSVSIRVRVSPLLSGTSRHYSRDVLVGLEPYCDACQADNVQIALVYNTYVFADRQKLDTSWCVWPSLDEMRS